MRDHYTLNFPYMCQKQEASPAEAAMVHSSCTCITCITCVHVHILRCNKDWIQSKPAKFSDFLQAYISVIKYAIKLQ